jgi:hypothetical protein
VNSELVVTRTSNVIWTRCHRPPGPSSLRPSPFVGELFAFPSGVARFNADDGRTLAGKRRQQVRQELLGSHPVDLAGWTGLRPPILVPAVDPRPPTPGANMNGAFGVLHGVPALLPSAGGCRGAFLYELPCAHRQPALYLAGGLGHEKHRVI